MISQWRKLAPAFLLLWSIPALAEPRPPCGTTPLPPYADIGAVPNVQVWTDRDLPPEWTPPACTGWTSKGARVLVALAGSFRHPGTADDLLARFGKISALRDIRYWSVTDKAWKPLITDAAALAGPDAGARRPDFTVSEMKEHRTLYFVQEDNRSSNEVIYRMQVHESSPDRLVIAMENISAARLLFLELFGPGDLQSVYFLERRSPEIWGYYSLSRTGLGASALTGGQTASYVNRAVALYRHVIGVPTDRDPAVAP